MKLIFKFAFKDIVANKKDFLLLVLNLSLGIVGFTTLLNFRVSIQDSISTTSRQTLGADYGLSARQPIPDSVVDKALKASVGKTEQTRSVEMLSMVASNKGRSRLVQLKAIQSNYPFYGGIETSENLQVENLNSGNNVWIYPELLKQLDISVGDQLKIGSKEFNVTSVVNNDSAQGISTGMAPRVYLSMNGLDASGLLSEKSLAWHSVLFKVPSEDPNLPLTIEDTLKADLTIPEYVRVFSHKSSSDQTARLLNYLGDYLGLAALAALFLCAIGISYLMRSHLQVRIQQIAILQSLGYTQGKSLGIYLCQASIVGLFAGLISTVASYFSTLFLLELTQSLLASNLAFVFSIQAATIPIVLGIGISILIVLPILFQFFDLKPAYIFAEARNLKLTPNKYSISMLVINLIVFWLAAMMVSNSIQVGSLFFLAILVATLFLGASVYGILIGLRKFSSPLSYYKKFALLSLVRKPAPTLSSFLALSLGLFLINLLPQLEASLQAELQSPEKSKLPSLFLFDIQEEQIGQLETLATSEKINFTQVSPMVRARLVKVNGKDFERSTEQAVTREDEQEQRFRNRGFNLSYRDTLSESEKIIKGRAFSGAYDESSAALPEISIETRFADRLGLDIGDELTFDIQSIPVTGKIINRRSVRWTSFQPNFFILFQTGVLEPAPKTYLATTASLASLEKDNFQLNMANAFPNVSIIDVTRLVERMLGITNQMNAALKGMAFLSFVVGILVLISIIRQQSYDRKQDMNLIKDVGGTFSFIRKTLLFEFLLLAGAAGLFGVVISLIVSFTLSTILFDGVWAFNPYIPIGSFALLFGITFFVTNYFCGKIFSDSLSRADS